IIYLHANKNAILTQVSNELIRDGIGFDEQLSGALPKAIAYFLDRAFLITGTGQAQPMSVLNAPATITVLKEASQATGTLLLANLAKMFSRMAPASFPNSVWLAHPTTIPQLLQTTITVGTGGSFVPLLQGMPNNPSIYTRPVIFTEKMNALSAKG